MGCDKRVPEGGRLGSEPDQLAIREFEIAMMLCRWCLVEGRFDSEHADRPVWILDQFEANRAEEPESLARGMTPNNGAQFGDQRFLDLRKSLVVGRGESDHESIRRNRTSPDIERSVGFQFLHESAADLDRLKTRTEDAGEDTLDQSLQAILEVPQHHGQTVTGPKPDRGSQVLTARLRSSNHMGLPSPLREWRNWQTRWIQVPVS